MKSKNNDWDKVVLKIGGVEIESIAPISYKQSIGGEADDLPMFRYCAVVEISRSDYEALINLPAYDEEASDKRINAIGQNGNTGEHYKTRK